MVTIKEIAKLSGVSIATVSKIINNKANDISQETIDKVLEIVKKYDYRPYGFTNKNQTSKTFTIAILLRHMYHTNPLLAGITNNLTNSGYSLMVFNSDFSHDLERLNLHKIIAKNVDGLLWQPIDSKSLDNVDLFKNTQMNVVYLDSLLSIGDLTYSISYEKLSYFATKTLIEKGHTNIACLIKDNESTRSHMAISGFKQCLFDYNILFNENMIVSYDTFSFENFYRNNFTGIVSSHFVAAQKVYENLEFNNVHVPTDISMISLCSDERNEIDIRNISIVRIPNYNFGLFVSDKIISLCENKETDKNNFDEEIELVSEVSITVPYNRRLPKVVVVGSLNMDNIIYLDELPAIGKTQYASECMYACGGKALNQAVGVSKLKKEAIVIGKIGKDNEANIIRDYLNQNNINTTNIYSSNSDSTGKAFVNISSSGESTIAIAKGANNKITQNEIARAAKAFENAGVCLLQSEIPLEAINEAKKIAKKNKAITIFKPSTIRKLKDEDYENVDIFIPNRSESLLLSKKKTIEEAAEYFYSKGIENIIITLDKDGALLKNKDGIKYFNAPNVMAIDTTGGSDAFIAALACQLIDNDNLESAIKIANIAASFCVTRIGAANSLVDYETLQRSIKQLSVE